MTPYIRAVMSKVDRNIAHNGYAVTLAVNLKLVPLSKEFELGKFVDFNLRSQSFSPFV